MKPGLRQKWQGRANVLLTHPRSPEIPGVLFRTLEIPTCTTTALQFAASNHPKGNWTLIVPINGDEVLKKSIEDSTGQEFRLDLTKHAGERIKIEVENRSSDWAFEAASWSRIELHEE